MTTAKNRAPSTPIRMPRLMLPLTSPAMYAEYWNPMYWNSTTLIRNGSTAVLKLMPCPTTLPVTAALCSAATVIPVYFGRLASKLERCTNASPATHMTTQESSPIAPSPVTMRWNLRVGWITTTRMSAITTSAPIMPGQLVMVPPEVNHPLARLKKPVPVPMPMISPLICVLRSTIGTSNAMTASDANTSVNDSTQARKGPATGISRLVKT